MVNQAEVTGIQVVGVNASNCQQKEVKTCQEVYFMPEKGEKHTYESSMNFRGACNLKISLFSSFETGLSLERCLAHSNAYYSRAQRGPYLVLNSEPLFVFGVQGIIMRIYDSNESNHSNSRTIAFHAHYFNLCNVFVQKISLRNLALHFLHLEGFFSSRIDTIHI